RLLHEKCTPIVETLFNRLLLRSRVLEAIRTDVSIDPKVRPFALDMARNRPEPAYELNEASWNLIKQPGRDPSDYRTALLFAEAAIRYIQEGPGQYGAWLNTLGVAQYRAGQTEKALDSLTRSNQLNGNKEPADLAFLALTQHRLGQTEASRVTL